MGSPWGPLEHAQRLPLERLWTIASRALEARAVPRPDAALAAERLVRADARGYGAHGIWRLDYLLARLDAGTIAPRARPRIVADLGALVMLDGARTLGQCAAATAFRLATERAEHHGIGAVNVGSSHHVGAAQAHTEPVAREGYVALFVTNASPALAPHGGSAPLLGNNPWSLAAPNAAGAPVVIDTTTSAVSRGEILLARDAGQRIPFEWALDAAGEPTDDPIAALGGVLQPIGGHKGAALSIAADMLSGVLSGSGWLDQVAFPGAADHDANVSYLTLVLDVRRATTDYPDRVASYLQRIHSVAPRRGAERVTYPGELEAEREADARVHGVPLRTEAYAAALRHAETLDMT